jgi:hypothetical protein
MQKVNSPHIEQERGKCGKKMLPFGVPVINARDANTFSLHLQYIKLRETTIYTEIFDNVFIL